MSTAQEVRTSRNWNAYNHNLRKRGSIIFSIDEQAIPMLYYKGKQKRGGARQFSPLMFEYLLTVKVFLKLPWRATVGFVEALFKRTFPNLSLMVPDYTHASREANKLALTIRINKPSAQAGMELAFDSTGVNVYHTSGWHQRNYGKKALFHNKE